MPTVPMEFGMMLAAAVTTIGVVGVLVRRNLLLMLLSLELMLNGAAAAFIVAGARWHQPDGQIMFLFVLAVTATETGIALALVLRIHHHLRTLDADRTGRPSLNRPGPVNLEDERIK